MLIRRLAAAAAAGFLALAVAPAAHADTTALNAQDKAFHVGAHQSNLAEIAAGKLAQSKGRSAAVKEIGAMLISDHTKLDATLRKLAATKHVSLPSAPNAEQQAAAAKLEAASDDQFDTVFVSTQLAGHMKAMQLGKDEAAGGEDAATKAAAAAAAPVIAHHGEMLRSAARELGVPTDVNAGRVGVAAESNTAEWLAFAAGLALVAGGGVLLVRRRVHA